LINTKTLKQKEPGNLPGFLFCGMGGMGMGGMGGGMGGMGGGKLGFSGGNGL